MPFTQVNDSSFLVKDLRFGHFSVCGNGTETDVLGIVGSPVGKWMVTCGALGTWIPLPTSLTNTIDGLVVADFNGDGIADVLTASSDGWQISYGGSQPWVDAPQTLWGRFGLLAVAGVGHFRGQPQADVLVWNAGLIDPLVITGTEFFVSAAGISDATVYSTQDMR